METTQVAADAVTNYHFFAQYEFLALAIIIIAAVPFLAPYLSTMSFGLIKFQTLSSALRDVEWDTEIRELVGKEINVIDYETRSKMRQTVRNVTVRVLRKFPDAEDAIYKARPAISTSICDNHITYELHSNLRNFIQSKAEACEAEVFRPINKVERDAIIWGVVHWCYEIARLHKAGIEQKLDIYNRALGGYRTKRFKHTCETLIEKNNEYLDSIGTLLENDIEEVIEHSGIIDTTLRHMETIYPLSGIKVKKRRKDDPSSIIVRTPLPEALSVG